MYGKIYWPQKIARNRREYVAISEKSDKFPIINLFFFLFLY